MTQDGPTDGAGAPEGGWTPPVQPAPTAPASPPPGRPSYAAPPSEWTAFAPPEQRPPGRRWPWVVGAATLVLVGGLAVALAWGSLAGLATELLDPQPAEGQTWVLDMKAGDCYLLDSEDRSENMAGYVAVTPCTVPHDGEVYGVVALEFDAWPGRRAADAAADEACGRVEDVLDEGVYDVESIGPGWYYPDDEDAWQDEEHVVHCVLESDTALGLTRSWRIGSSAPAPSA